MNTHTFHVVGITHYADNLDKLSYENDDFNMSKKECLEEYGTDEKIYRLEYTCSPVKLVPEPDNKYDPNAIRVDVNSMTIGYIKKEDTEKVRALLANSEFNNYSISIDGGEYKYSTRWNYS